VNSSSCCFLDAILVANQSAIYYFRKRWNEEIMPSLEVFFQHSSPPSMSAPAKASIIYKAEALALFLDAESAFMGRIHTRLHEKYPRMIRISPPFAERVALTDAEKRRTLLRFGVRTRNLPIPQLEVNDSAQNVRRYRVPSAEVESLRKLVRIPVMYATACREVRLAMFKATRRFGDDDPSLLDTPDFSALAMLDTAVARTMVKKWTKVLYFLYAEEHLALLKQKAVSLNLGGNVQDTFKRLTSNFEEGLPVTVAHAEAIRSEFDFVCTPRNATQSHSNVPDTVRNVAKVTSIGKNQCSKAIPYVLFNLFLYETNQIPPYCLSFKRNSVNWPAFPRILGLHAENGN
jgi:hypothetical protein